MSMKSMKVKYNIAQHTTDCRNDKFFSDYNRQTMSKWHLQATNKFVLGIHSRYNPREFFSQDNCSGWNRVADEN